MSKSLNAFLNPVQLENRKVVVSKRFIDQETNKAAEWEIRPITSAENDMLLKKHLRKDKKGNEVFDRLAYQNELIVSAVVYPDLHNAELQSHWGVLGATALISKMLLIGEFTDLAVAVKELSGLDDESDDLVEEAKN